MSEAVASRVRLRDLEDADIAAVEPWYHEAMVAASGVAPDAPTIDLPVEVMNARAAGGILVIERDKSQGPIGLLDYRRGPAEGWITIAFLALAAGHRGWGYGTDAVRQFESDVPARHYLAKVERGNGLGLYFWLRLGYHPARANEAFWQAPGEGDTIAMIRNQNQEART
jgi:hypothetical protein